MAAIKTADALIISEAREYDSAEYIRDLIRREQERGAEIEVIRSALIEGEKIGKPKRFDADAFRRKLCRVHG